MKIVPSIDMRAYHNGGAFHDNIFFYRNLNALLLIIRSLLTLVN